MRITSSALIGAFGSVMFTLAACSSALQLQPYGPSSSAVGPPQLRSGADDVRSGRSQQFLALRRLPQLALRDLKPTKDGRVRDLYVSDFRTVLLLKNGGYKSAGAITKGLVSPDGDYVDAAGNFYVADYDGVDIQEYKPGGRSPSFTYRQGMIDPINVSVDSHGNVYEADYDGWYVNEYAQKSNAVISSCSPGGAVEGVAVDADGDVFVDYNQQASGSGRIAEYKGGLGGCHEKTFKLALEFAGGIVLDAHRNLIVVDQNAPAVDVIKPPYSSVTGTLGSGYLAPFMVTLNKSNKLAFVTDLYVVDVVDYRYGSVVKMISLGYGDAPAGAVDDPNAVY